MMASCSWDSTRAAGRPGRPSFSTAYFTLSRPSWKACLIRLRPFWRRVPGSPVSLARAVRSRRRASVSISSPRARLCGFSNPMMARNMSGGWGRYYPAGDAIAGIDQGLGAVIVAPLVQDHRHPVPVENGLLAIAQAEAGGDQAGAQAAVGAGELVGQVARHRAALGLIAMPLAGHQAEDGAGGGKARFGVAIGRTVQVDAMGAGGEAVQVEGDQHPMIDGGEIHRADRLAFQVGEAGDGLGLLGGGGRERN